MHKFTLPQAEIARSISNRGTAHPFGTLDPAKTALVVIDMQNYFIAPGAQGEIPMARDIVPAINRLAQAMRAAGSHVIWVQTSTNDTRESWSVMANHLMSPVRAANRWAAMDEAGEGFKLWPALDAKPEDVYVIKKRFSAFIQGSSDIESYFKKHGIDTLLIAGTASNGCCEVSARDAVMLNYKVVMVSDANATYTDDMHGNCLQFFYLVYGDVLTVDEAITGLARTAPARLRSA
jgi:ureidoacrylate peracid hydrolase